jgi:capsular exopolysaccharide synthesis family protein
MNSSARPPQFNLSSMPEDSDDGEVGQNNFLRNSWLLVLERKWYSLTVFLLTVLAAAVYTFMSTPIYEGSATVQVLKHGPQVMRVADVVESSVTSDTDYNTQVKVLQSVAIVQNVVNRLTPEELKQLTDPYKSRSGEPVSAVEIVYKNRNILPQRLSLITVITYRHPNPKMAARVANLIASEYITYNSRLRIEESLKAVDELKDRADQQRKRVDEIANALQAFRQRGNLISLMQSKDIVTEKLKALNMLTTQTNSRLKEAEVRWNQVQDWTKAGKDLSELPFIASQTKVSQLILQATTQKVALSQMQERYKAKHPRLIEAVNGLAQTELELRTALEMAAASIKSEYENALQNDEGARRALADQETKSLDLDKSAVEYENLNREFRVNDQLLESMMTRMRETSVTSSIDMESARIIDRANEPTRPISPKVGFNLALGVMGGIFFGFSFAFIVATIDDRVKTTFDVESLIGLPLLGVIPRVERMEQPDKAQIVSNGADRTIVEAFLSLYSTLRVNDESRGAKLLLVTSTLPGEGKSFIATNLAQTFAAQGQRTIIVDCDLRKPNVQQSFRLQPGKGVISYCLHGAKLDEIIVRNVHPNLDVITVGGRAKNPIQLLNSKEFETLITELGKRYDRVIFDTPPLGAVSDALNILSLMDGAIYAIRYNYVKRGMAQVCARRLLSANIPVFGAVMNDMSAGVAGDYYSENSKLFKDYYNVPAEDSVERTPRSQPA